MNISLDIKIPLIIQEGGEIKEELEVFYRDYTKTERKEFDELVKKFKKLFVKVSKLGQQENTLNKKIDLYEKMKKYEEAFSLIEAKDALLVEVEKISAEIEKIGGNDFEETMAKKRFDALISGADKEKLREIAMIRSYKDILQAIDDEKAEFEKKRRGE